MDVVGIDVCGVYEGFDVEKHICAKPIEGKELTGDDAGSGLILSSSTKNNPTILGILSARLQEHFKHNMPAVYIRVSSYISWIKKNAKMCNY